MKQIEFYIEEISDKGIWKELHCERNLLPADRNGFVFSYLKQVWPITDVGKLPEGSYPFEGLETGYFYLDAFYSAYMLAQNAPGPISRAREEFLNSYFSAFFLHVLPRLSHYSMIHDVVERRKIRVIFAFRDSAASKSLNQCLQKTEAAL